MEYLTPKDFEDDNPLSTSAIGGFSAATEITSKAEFEKVQTRIRAGANIRFDVKKRVRLADKAAVSIARPLSKETRLAPQDFAQIVNTDTSKDRIFATIEYASLPAHSDFSVRVFVNLPNASSGTSTQDPHFAGSFAFFKDYFDAGHIRTGESW